MQIFTSVHGCGIFVLKNESEKLIRKPENPKTSPENTCARVSFNKVVGLSPATLLKKRLWHRVLVIMRAIMIPYSEKAEM